jgi:hypothetical protein
MIIAGKLKWFLILSAILSCGTINFSQEPVKNDQLTISSLTLVPPSPITNKVKLDIRGAVSNKSSQSMNYQVSLYIDNVDNNSIFIQKI